ncbi:SMC family ATPase [Companilactobacillus sp. HBUAS59699]|uniref:SMC family ATPase n=1 Tax=Companilactobacillus sp. HBUAS59699 TaxID=3109358 RepID=UPI002FF038DC
MKPVYLEMNYFGPHEHSIIDFRKLEEAPIFLIGGDTGAGKSTIFDAMTFALFGSTTSDRDAREMRSQFAPDNKETSVIFYFEQGNNLYKIERTPEQRLEKKTRGKGLTTRKTTALLSIVEKVGGTEIQSIASKPMDVGNEITDILKLNADQFKKIILLPQNDFSEFLKAKTDDKVSILKKIFGTQIFDDFTDKLKVKYDEARKQNGSFETEVNNQITAMKLSDDELTKLQHEADSQRITILKDFVSTRKTNMTKAQTEAETTNQTLNEADKKLQDANNIKQKLDRLADLRKQYQAEITAQKQQIDQHKTHVSELDWANKLKDTVKNLDRNRQDNKQSVESQTEISKQLAVATKEHDTAKNDLAELIKQQPDIDAKTKRVDELSSLIPLISRREKLQQNLTEVKPQIETITKKIEQQTEVSEQITADIKTQQQKLIPVDELQKQKDALLVEKNDFVDALSPIENKRDNAQSELNKLQDKSLKLKNKLEECKSKLEAAKDDYQQKIGTRQSLMIAQLQQELVDGEPCVVCGSTVHPNVTNIVKADEQELKKSIDAVDASQKAFAAAEQNLKAAQKNIDDNNESLNKQKSTLNDLNKTLTDKYHSLSASSKLDFPEEFNMTKIKNIFEQQVKELDQNLAESAKLIQIISDLETKLNKNNDQISSAQLKLTDNKSKQDTYQKDLTEISAKITESDKTSQELTEEQKNIRQAIKDFTNNLDASKQKAHQSEIVLSSGKTQLADINKQLDKQKSIIETLQTQLNNALSATDAKTNSVDILNDWITEIESGIDTKLKETISSYNKEKELLDNDIKKLADELTDTKMPDIAQLQQRLTDMKEANKAAVTKAVQLKLTYDNAHEGFNKIKDITKKQSDFGKKLTEITSLYNVITGKDGNDDKLKLETYVVQNYLRKVLDYANKTFINTLSNNRYSFEIAAQGSDKRTDHGLDINVYDNETGATRSSDTLSGGETFIAALSIALSLSEVVQSSANGVKIDALFIDEGFGSLDHETLDKAMSALETIGENRMVGVISHIEAMKTTIGQQVLIKKVGDGRSKVEIVTK